MKWTRKQIFEELKAILISADERKRSAVEACTEASYLAEDIGLSSVGILYIVIAAEETFRIRFENVSGADFMTVGNVIDYIEAKLQ